MKIKTFLESSMPYFSLFLAMMMMMIMMMMMMMIWLSCFLFDCSQLYCIVLYCIVLYSTVLYFSGVASRLILVIFVQWLFVYPPNLMQFPSMSLPSLLTTCLLAFLLLCSMVMWSCLSLSHDASKLSTQFDRWFLTRLMECHAC